MREERSRAPADEEAARPKYRYGEPGARAQKLSVEERSERFSRLCEGERCVLGRFWCHWRIRRRLLPIGDGKRAARTSRAPGNS